MWTNAYLAPAILCAAALCGGVCLYIIIYYRGVNPLAKLLSSVAAKIAALPPCRMENLERAAEIVAKTNNVNLIAAYARYKDDATILLNNEIAPEPSGYFHIKSVFGVPCAEYYHDLILKLAVAAAVVIAAAAPAYALITGAYTDGAALGGAFGASLIGVIWVTVLYAFIASLERRSVKRAGAALEKFTTAFCKSFPTAGKSAEVALLLAGAAQTHESFKESASLIVKKINNFAAESVTPTAARAFDLSIQHHISPMFKTMDENLRNVTQALLEKQDNGLKVLADRFSERLFTNIEIKMAELGKSVESVNVLLADVAGRFDDFAGQITECLSEDRATLSRAAGFAEKTAEAQRTTAESMQAFSVYLSEAKIVEESVKEQNASVLAAMERASELTADMAADHKKQLDESRAEYARQLEETRTYHLLQIEETQLLYAKQFAENTSEHTRQLMETKSMISDSVVAMRDTVGGVLTDLRNAADKTADENRRGAASIVADAKSMINETLQETKTAVSGALNEMKSAVDENGAVLLKTVSDNNENLQRIVELNGETLGNAVTGASETIKNACELSGKIVAENAAANEGRFAEYLEAALARASEQEDRIKDYLAKSTESVMESLGKTAAQNSALAANLGATIDSLSNAGSEQYEKAAQAAANMLQDVVAEMNRAMDGVGKQIADSIGATLIESAEMVDKLAVQMSTLKQEYDSYFNKLDEQNKNAYDELDFHMQNVIARFSQETETVIGKLQESISSAMGLFEGNTATLLSNLDEQSRSIGLYAKELNYDISSLSASLKESVADFAEHLHKGVVTTFEDFDSGLSEVSKRFANMVESIRDSVENLPAALSGK